MPSLKRINVLKAYVWNGKGLKARLSGSGFIHLSLDFKFKKDVPSIPKDHGLTVDEFGIDEKGWDNVPNMNIVIMIVGSRGDVQPYVALGKELLKDGHRIRLATHETFRSFVTDAGLEFFNIGGNPQELMSYMVKNPGLMPGIASLTNGDIKRQRKMLDEMINGCWQACHAPCPVTGRHFAADAIISNPPTFAHVHCAEALGIPLLLSFTMPWSPTTAFPHPLVKVSKSNTSRSLTNYLSYTVGELLTWEGIGDIINKLRTKQLGLPALGMCGGAGVVDQFKVPWTYCMSPSLVPKPDDWKNHIDVVGFYFLDLASRYQPPEDLAKFLEAGDAPVYIGFGSVVVDNPEAMTKTIFEATKAAGVRALVSAGWGGLGGTEVPPHVFILGNVPHDWLFDNERVSAVVHHGGAGTTAIGLAKGRPTVVVPFFGDQGFWGSMIYRSGAGPKPIPPNKLDMPTLRDAIRYAVSPVAKEAARDMAEKIKAENGVKAGVESFYKHLPLTNMRCELDKERLAVWWDAKLGMRLSAFAAQVLQDAGELSMKDLELHRPRDYGSTKQRCFHTLKFMRSPKTPKRLQHQRETRVAEGIEALANSTAAERVAVLRKFAEAMQRSSHDPRASAKFNHDAIPPPSSLSSPVDSKFDEKAIVPDTPAAETNTKCMNMLAQLLGLSSSPGPQPRLIRKASERLRSLCN
ncbi:hypothetical protein BDQ17DRAFT_1071182 [Cyathus striatus]|nr:hypothetical protein BDQ17DRAFT_1071182 [Cyathus striatus]